MRPSNSLSNELRPRLQLRERARRLPRHEIANQDGPDAKISGEIRLDFVDMGDQGSMGVTHVNLQFPLLAITLPCLHPGRDQSRLRLVVLGKSFLADEPLIFADSVTLICADQRTEGCVHMRLMETTLGVPLQMYGPIISPNH